MLTRTWRTAVVTGAVLIAAVQLLFSTMVYSTPSDIAFAPHTGTREAVRGG